MLEKLSFQNFKCFRNCELDFRGLTLLTGFNAAGKSSAIQPLLILAQTPRVVEDASEVDLNGQFVSLGTVGDILPADSAETGIEFTVTDDGESTSWNLSAVALARRLTVEDRSSEPSNASGLSDLALKLRQLTFISAVRSGAEDAYPVPGSVTDVNVGVDGRYAAFWFTQFADEEIPAPRRHVNEPAGIFRKQINAWLGMLFPGAQADSQLIQLAQVACLSFRSGEVGVWRRPSNVGYGYTYAFPILVALLTAKEGQVVVIDSPEAHLHPSAQSQMGQMLSHFAQAGVQIIVESHSDHLLNGVRLAVKAKVLDHNNLRVHFFTGAYDSKGVPAPNGGIRHPSVDESGRIDSWPDGFFDQTEKDLAGLAGWS